MLDNLIHFVKSLTSANPEYQGRRAHRRHARCTLLTIQPLDEELSADGDPFWAMSQNVSHKGIGFTCEQAISQSYLRVTIKEDNFSAIARIVHERQMSETPVKYFVGCEFVDDYYCHGRYD